ncbi:MAG: S-layer homology domain-containing protein [Clostridia bacterium]|nr:S-layer homology domain-containing protein [Clostridia bacterium]
MISKLNLKKAAACTLTVAMLTPLMGSAALADPPSHAKAHGREKIPFKIVQLTDIRGHWAEEILAEMSLSGLIKGYEDNRFHPSNVVKNVEALVMLVRGLGLEEEAQRAVVTDLKQFKKIPDWARGYVQIALDRGLITPEDLDKLNPNQGMKRAQLCAILAKALDLDPEEGYKCKLDFSDAKAIPEDLLKFVCVIVENGIMKGYDNNVFQPNKPVTRAEMAVLLERLGDLLQEENNNGRLEGTVAKLGRDKITVKTDDTARELPLDDDVVIYLNRERAVLEDLAVGDKIRLTIRDGKVVFIRAQRSAVVETVHEGRLTRLVLGTNSRVTITDQETDLTFAVDSNTRIWVGGKRALLKDLEVGRDVLITAQGDIAVRIEM